MKMMNWYFCRSLPRERVNEHNNNTTNKNEKKNAIFAYGVWMKKKPLEQQRYKRTRDGYVIHDPTNENEKKNLHQFVISNDGIAAIASSAAAAATNEPIT